MDMLEIEIRMNEIKKIRKRIKKLNDKINEIIIIMNLGE